MGPLRFYPVPGVDYGEIFSPVVKPAIVRIVLSGSFSGLAHSSARYEEHILTWHPH
jgi:hypothetical protein